MPIHPLAVVDPQAEIHPDAIIGPFCVITGAVRLEAGVELKNHATVCGRTTIGRGSVLYQSCVVGGDPQDLKFRGEDSEVIIGERCRIHEFATINKGTAGGGMKTVIGDDCLIMAYAHVAHDCQLAEQVILGNNAQLAGHVKVARKAIIGGMSGVHHFATIGELAFIVPMSGVRTDIPPYLLVEGLPAEPRNLNLVGLRRDGMSDPDIAMLKDAFRLLFHDRSGTPMVERIQRLRSQDAACAPLHRLLHWLGEHIETSVKGRVQEATRPPVIVNPTTPRPVEAAGGAHTG